MSDGPGWRMGARLGKIVAPVREEREGDGAGNGEQDRPPDQAGAAHACALDAAQARALRHREPARADACLGAACRAAEGHRDTPGYSIRAISITITMRAGSGSVFAHRWMRSRPDGHVCLVVFGVRSIRPPPGQ